LAQSDGVSREEYGAAVEQVLVTAGSNQLLHLLSEVMLDPGDVVLCAAPTYFVVLGTLAGCGAQAMGVATDDHGMIPEALAEQFAAFHCRGQSNRVKLVYVVSYSDNPRGVTMPRERREQLLEVVDRHNRQVHSGGEHPAVHVVADDAYRELRYGKEAAEEDVPSMRSMDDTRETVIHVETFSKSFSPGIRVGWGLLPEHLVGPLLEVKGNVDFGSPNLNQHVVHRAMERGLFDEHVANLRQTYRPKLEATLSAAKEHLAPLGVESVLPSGGLYVWCELPPPMDAGPESELFAASLEEGMMYVPGELCFARTGEPVRRNTLRLSFGVQSPERIREGVAALARAIAKTHP